MRISNLTNYNITKTSFKRHYRNKDEKLKQYELNRNKSIDYILEGRDKEFYDRVQELRKQGITKDFPADIRAGMGEMCFEIYDEITEYDSFNYPKIYRGIGKSELDALREGKQIYSKERENLYGVDTTNHPGGIGYGKYLVEYKLKPNLDHYISDIHKFKFEREKMPHIGGWGPGNSGTSHHSILQGTYTLNDVEKITDLKTKEVLYDSKKDEIIPNKEVLLSNLNSNIPKLIIKSLENLQTYYGDGKLFLPQAEHLLNSDDQEVVDCYINALYNYGSKDDMPRLFDYTKNNEELSANVISRIANCVEKFQPKEKDSTLLDLLVDKALKIEDKEDKLYAFKNINDAIQSFGRPINDRMILCERYLKIDDDSLQEALRYDYEFWKKYYKDVKS